MSEKDGGAAFPAMNDSMTYDGSKPVGGMSLRDYFAAAALQGVMKDNANVKSLWGASQDESRDVAEFIAEKMYSLADAMLKERTK